MLATYKAILRGNQLEWSEGGPNTLPEQEVAVFVTVLDEHQVQANTLSRGQRMAAALERLAAAHASDDALNPEQWEGELRQDRSLPGRE